MEAGANFKAADIAIPIYIYNVSKETTLCDITNYIEKRAHLKVTMEKINMTLTKEYDAYKVFLPRHKLGLFLNDNF